MPDTVLVVKRTKVPKSVSLPPTMAAAHRQADKNISDHTEVGEFGGPCKV